MFFPSTLGHKLINHSWRELIKFKVGRPLQTICLPEIKIPVLHTFTSERNTHSFLKKTRSCRSFHVLTVQFSSCHGATVSQREKDNVHVVSLLESQALVLSTCLFWPVSSRSTREMCRWLDQPMKCKYHSICSH